MKRLPFILAPVSLVAVAFAQNQRALEPITPVAGPLQGQQVYATSHALVIRVNQYPTLPPRSQLHYTMPDAAAGLPLAWSRRNEERSSRSTLRT